MDPDEKTSPLSGTVSSAPADSGGVVASPVSPSVAISSESSYASRPPPPLPPALLPSAPLLVPSASSSPISPAVSVSSSSSGSGGVKYRSHRSGVPCPISYISNASKPFASRVSAEEAAQKINLKVGQVDGLGCAFHSDVGNGPWKTAHVVMVSIRDRTHHDAVLGLLDDTFGGNPRFGAHLVGRISEGASSPFTHPHSVRVRITRTAKAPALEPTSSLVGKMLEKGGISRDAIDAILPHKTQPLMAYVLFRTGIALDAFFTKYADANTGNMAASPFDLPGLTRMRLPFLQTTGLHARWATCKFCQAAYGHGLNKCPKDGVVGFRYRSINLVTPDILCEWKANTPAEFDASFKCGIKLDSESAVSHMVEVRLGSLFTGPATQFDVFFKEQLSDVSWNSVSLASCSSFDCQRCGVRGHSASKCFSWNMPLKAAAALPAGSRSELLAPGSGRPLARVAPLPVKGSSAPAAAAAAAVGPSSSSAEAAITAIPPPPKRRSDAISVFSPISPSSAPAVSKSIPDVALAVEVIHLAAAVADATTPRPPPFVKDAGRRTPVSSKPVPDAALAVGASHLAAAVADASSPRPPPIDKGAGRRTPDPIPSSGGDDLTQREEDSLPGPNLPKAVAASPARPPGLHSRLGSPDSQGFQAKNSRKHGTRAAHHDQQVPPVVPGHKPSKQDTARRGGRKRPN